MRRGYLRAETLRTGYPEKREREAGNGARQCGAREGGRRRARETGVFRIGLDGDSANCRLRKCFGLRIHITCAI
jgi:hypothetical protein